MGFDNKWRSWIRGCLSSSRASIMVNGSPTMEFDITKGVRQRDPLWPFLFIIAMEGLNIAMKSAKEKGIYTGVQLPRNGPLISHLFYADDALFVGEWSKSNLKNLARILKCFHVSSSLRVNPKSSALALQIMKLPNGPTFLDVWQVHYLLPT
ncbi:hypothetical protein Lser_V15G32699 [Lactuca serriola]